MAIIAYLNDKRAVYGGRLPHFELTPEQFSEYIQYMFRVAEDPDSISDPDCVEEWDKQGRAYFKGFKLLRT